jgi:hypothetical protein
MAANPRDYWCPPRNTDDEPWGDAGLGSHRCAWGREGTAPKPLCPTRRRTRLSLAAQSCDLRWIPLLGADIETLGVLMTRAEKVLLAAVPDGAMQPVSPVVGEVLAWFERLRSLFSSVRCLLREGLSRGWRGIPPPHARVNQPTELPRSRQPVLVVTPPIRARGASQNWSIERPFDAIDASPSSRELPQEKWRDSPRFASQLDLQLCNGPRARIRPNALLILAALMAMAAPSLAYPATA